MNEAKYPIIMFNTTASETPSATARTIVQPVTVMGVDWRWRSTSPSSAGSRRKRQDGRFTMLTRPLWVLDNLGKNRHQSASGNKQLAPHAYDYLDNFLQ